MYCPVVFNDPVCQPTAVFLSAVFLRKASLPIATFPSPDTLKCIDCNPIATFSPPSTLRNKDSYPIATLLDATVLAFNELCPTATLYKPSVRAFKLSLPKPVFFLRVVEGGLESLFGTFPPPML